MVTAQLYTALQTHFPHISINENLESPSVYGNDGKVTVYPTTEKEVQCVLQYAHQHGMKVNVKGGGTKSGCGGLVQTADILLSLERMKGIVEHAVGDMTVTVKAGTTFYELQQYLSKDYQTVPCDPAWPEKATIGGIIAANDSGPKRLGYGSARDTVIGLRVVYPDGRIIRTGGKVVKNVAGYDMNKLFIGSMGTLGVITEVTLKLRPVPKYESVTLVAFPQGRTTDIHSLITALQDTHIEPVSLELFNPTLARRLTGQRRCTLAISFEDNASAVHAQEALLQDLLPPTASISVLTQEQARAWWQKVYALQPHGAESKSSPSDTLSDQTDAVLKIGVKAIDVISFLQDIDQAAVINESLNIEAHGSVGHGLCLTMLNGDTSSVLNAIHVIRQKAIDRGGYTVVKHLPFALRRQIDVWGDPPSTLPLLQGIKSSIDPKRILNDQRFVGGI